MPRGDMVILDLETEGNYLAVRPSGTEPKVKIYLFAYDPPANNHQPLFHKGRPSRATQGRRDRFPGIFGNVIRSDVFNYFSSGHRRSKNVPWRPTWR